MRLCCYIRENALLLSPRCLMSRIHSCKVVPMRISFWDAEAFKAKGVFFWCIFSAERSRKMTCTFLYSSFFSSALVKPQLFIEVIYYYLNIIIIIIIIVVCISCKSCCQLLVALFSFFYSCGPSFHSALVVVDVANSFILVFLCSFSLVRTSHKR